MDSTYRVWTSAISPISWSQIGVPLSQIATTFAAGGGKTYASSAANQLWVFDGSWTDIGHANQLNALTYDSGNLYATVAPKAPPGVTLSPVVSRSATGDDLDWVSVSPSMGGINAATWYALNSPATITVGRDPGTPVATYQARSFSAPEGTDLVMLRLENSDGSPSPVPSAQAIPRTVVLTAPSYSSGTWFKLAGYGAPVGVTYTSRRYGWANGFSMGSGNSANAFNLTILNGMVDGGDSGLGVVEYLDRTRLVGVNQSQQTTVPLIMATWATSFTRTSGEVFPNIAGWLGNMID